MIEPADIRNQSFKKGLFGYKSSDVDGFVNVVYRAYDELYKKHAELKKEFEKSEATLKENRIKIFDLEAKIQDGGGASSSDSGDVVNAQKRADDIIKNAEAAAAEIIAKAKAQGEKLERSAASAAKASESKLKMASKPEEKVSEPKTSASSSKFFKKAAEEHVTSSMEEDDEIFVGEIEDARKPDRMMIGDGEEEEDMDFEFL